MAVEQAGLLQMLAEVEQAAEEVLATKQEVVDLDRKRNSNREAIRALERQAKEHYKGEASKSWLAMGNSFFRLPNRGAVAMLKADQVNLDLSVNKLRTELKDCVYKLRELEGKEELKGFGLKAMGKEELAAIDTVISGGAKANSMYFGSIPNV
jgi:hypothetical protein